MNKNLLMAIRDSSDFKDLDTQMNYISEQTGECFSPQELKFILASGFVQMAPPTRETRPTTDGNTIYYDILGKTLILTERGNNYLKNS